MYEIEFVGRSNYTLINVYLFFVFLSFLSNLKWFYVLCVFTDAAH